jgi:hypothetical protein
VEADVVVESVEDWVVWTLLGWLKEVVRERRRAVKGVGKGAGIRDITVGDDDDGDDEDSSSIVVSRPSKKVMRSGTALVKVSVVMGGRRSMVLVLLMVVCIMKLTLLLTAS